MALLERDRQILTHIEKYCEKIRHTVVRFGADFEAFLNDADYRDSVSMNLLQIGELAGKLSDDYVDESRAQMNWRAIKGMRNLFAHDYGSMDLNRIWDTVLTDIPELQAFCEHELELDQSETMGQSMT